MLWRFWVCDCSACILLVWVRDPNTLFPSRLYCTSTDMYMYIHTPYILHHARSCPVACPQHDYCDVMVLHAKSYFLRRSYQACVITTKSRNRALLLNSWPIPKRCLFFSEFVCLMQPRRNGETNCRINTECLDSRKHFRNKFQSVFMITRGGRLLYTTCHFMGGWSNGGCVVAKPRLQANAPP